MNQHLVGQLMAAQGLNDKAKQRWKRLCFGALALLSVPFSAIASQAQSLDISPTTIEYSHELGEDAFAAVGLSYQGDLSLANFLSADDGALDLPKEPITLSLAGGWDRRDDSRNPTQGSKLEVGVEQLIPLQGNVTAANLLRANYTQWVPVDLPGLRSGDQTLVLNVQGGSTLSNATAFELGGANSVRGYGDGELGSGQRYVQATAEYRFPLLSAQDLEVGSGVGLGGLSSLGFGGLGGSVFVDYANVAGGNDDARSGQGLGVGAGVNAKTPLGLMRLELAVNDQREAKLGFRLGDRF